MSHEQIKEQHDKIVSIDMKVSDLLKVGKILVPILLGLIGVVVWIGTKAISLNEWNKSLVKQEQFSKYQMWQVKQDSIQNAKIDTLNKNKIGYKDLKVQALNTKRVIKRDLKGVTARKDEYGNITYTPIF